MRILLYVLLFLSWCDSAAQGIKKLTPADYGLWSTLNQAQMSADGKWVCYGVKNEKADTLFLHSSKNRSSFAFPKGRNSSFSPNSKWFSCFQNDSLKLFNLEKNAVSFVKARVSDYQYSTDGSSILIFLKKDNFKNLEVLNLNTKKSFFIEGIVSYQLSLDRKRIALLVNESAMQLVKVITFGNAPIEQEVVRCTLCEFKNLKWDDGGNKLTFFKATKTDLDPSLVLYWSTGFEGKISVKTLDSTCSIFPENSEFTQDNLYLPATGNLVFFTLKKKVLETSALNSSANGAVQVWKSSDLTIPPRGLKEKNSELLLWHLWNIDRNVIYPVEDELHTRSIVTKDSKHALVYNPEELAAVYKCSNEFIAMYVKTLATGEKKRLSDRQALLNNGVVVSTTGKYIAYFNANTWWIYDVNLDKHRCVSKGIANLHKLDYDRGGLAPPVSKPSWSANDSEFIFYDQYDIWSVTPDGARKKRLTDGSKQKIIYRICETTEPKSPNYYSYGFLSGSHDLKSVLLLKTEHEDTYAQGFSLLHPIGVLKVLLDSDGKCDLVNRSSDRKSFLFSEQRFNLSPRLLHVNLEGKVYEIYQSNKHQALFQWGKSKLVTYANTNGTKLKGALFYPEHYDSTKKYPLLVVIYERKSKEVFDYSTPSLASYWGFSLANFVTDGYFVLYPDITFTIDRPGEDALDCVTASVEAALKDYPIDEKSIGLMGHSFGGYETAYIMGKTKLFKTAVVGSAVVDLVDNYLTLDGHGVSNMWRYEYDQMRIKAPFYSEKFRSNLPLENVSAISSPVLIWTGTNDLQLDWKNSMKLHTALWKLGKKSTLLVYPNEGHVLSKLENKIDLTMKVKQWLDYYLKQGAPEPWLE
ncbi:prolyl oligopeptidase family serine peptidase [Flavobacterium ardleyense]|uniref:Prolyl oligopeptidase family serine peptidase n=1 Tax=Flavobacterium ardleyense TaxID=2038737 RepID=A0ABW5Z630_9FLAO